jgi:hypothetical protein
VQQRDTVEHLDVQAVGAARALVVHQRVAQPGLGLDVVERRIARQRGLHRAHAEGGELEELVAVAPRERGDRRTAESQERTHPSHLVILPDRHRHQSPRYSSPIL